MGLKRWSGLAVSCLFLLQGCSQSSAVEVADADAPVVAEASPLGRYLGGDYSENVRQWQILAQERLQHCMRLQGFSYEVSVSPIPASIVARDALSEEEWVKEYGYGILDKTLAGLDFAAADPNLRQYELLSPGDREAYLVALVGVVAAEPGASVIGIPLEEQGCSGQAVLESGGDALALGLDELSADLADEMARLDATDEMVGATAMWSECMAAIGWEVRSRSDATELAERKVAALLITLGDQLSHLSEPEMEALLGDRGNQALPPLSQRAIDQAKADEVQIAVDDFRCFVEHIEPILGPAQDVIENRLIDEHKTELDELSALLGQD